MNRTLLIAVPLENVLKVVDVLLSALNSFQNSRCYDIATRYGYANVLTAIHSEPRFKQASNIALNVLCHFYTTYAINVEVKCGSINTLVMYPQDLKQVDKLKGLNILTIRMNTDQVEVNLIMDLLQEVAMFAVNSANVWVMDKPEDIGGVLEPSYTYSYVVKEADVVIPPKSTFLVEVADSWLNFDIETGYLKYYTDKKTNIDYIPVTI